MDFETARRIMVDSQIRPNDVTDPEITAAFMATPREAFVSSAYREIAYSEYEIPTGEGRALWLPRDTAKLIKALMPKPQEVALVIGAGAGYEAALLAHLVETVIAVDDNETSTDKLTQRATKLGLDQIAAVEAPLTEGLPSEGPYDLIYVCGMVDHVPQALTGQLTEGGRLGVVVKQDTALGRARIYTRAGDTVSSRDVFECTPPVLSAFNQPKSFVF